MNNLTTKIKISVVFSLIAAGVVLTGCASKRSARSAAGAEAAVSSSSETASNSGAAATTAATTAQTTTGNVAGQPPITFEDLNALQAKGAAAGAPAAQ